MTDLEMAKVLTDIGWNVGYGFDENGIEVYDNTLVGEMAMNEGYKWDEENGKWSEEK